MEVKSYKSRDLKFGQAVLVYRNLHNNMFSIKDKKTGLVVAHANNFSIRFPLAKVSQGGRLRTISSKTRNVHAWVEGVYLESYNATPSENFLGKLKEIYYNPYVVNCFVIGDEPYQPKEEDIVYFYNEKCYLLVGGKNGNPAYSHL